jgi:hypothetical protein
MEVIENIFRSKYEVYSEDNLNKSKEHNDNNDKN